MSTRTAALPTEISIHKRSITVAGLLVTLGIIFGDIGTSPLYVFKSILGDRPVRRQLLLVRRQ